MQISTKGVALSGGLALAALFAGSPAFAASAPNTVTLETHHPAMQHALKRGSTGHWVLTLQADLALLGYSQVGQWDGIFGPKTQRALEAFQTRHGFPATGITSPAVWQDILAGFGLMPPVRHLSSNTKALAAVHPAMRQSLKLGSTGHWVMTLQADLDELGYNAGPWTGHFGSQTASALRTFEAANGFSATGITSPAVWQDILAGFGLMAPVQPAKQAGPTARTPKAPTVRTAPPKSTVRTQPTTTPKTTTPPASAPSGPILPAKFPTGPAIAEPSLPNTSAGIKGQFTPSMKTIDGRPVLKAFHMVATSYAPSLADNYPYGPVDAFGKPLEDGMVAVDPNVIPLGSVVYITGYHDNHLPSGGFLGKAMDTGGAIKGDRVDIFINASQQIVNDFGVQQVTLYLLGN